MKETKQTIKKNKTVENIFNLKTRIMDPIDYLLIIKLLYFICIVIIGNVSKLRDIFNWISITHWK